MELLVGCVLLFGVLTGAEKRFSFNLAVGQHILLSSPKYPDNALPLTDFKWELNAPPGAMITLACPVIDIKKMPHCLRGYLEIWDGQKKRKICKKVESYQSDSVGNQMTVQFKTFLFGGKFSCVARATPVDISKQRYSSIPGQEPSVTAGCSQTSCPCGWVNEKQIVRGESVNEYPFVVNIYDISDEIVFCAGTIITRRHILSAAHCFTKKTETDLMKVSISYHYHNISSDGHRSVIKETQAIYIFKMYKNQDFGKTDLTNDITILYLERNLEFNQFVGPVCLSQQRYDLLNNYIKVLSWGKESTGVMTTDVQVVELSRCANLFTNFIIDLKEPKQLCVYKEGKASATIDTGGPAVYFDKELNAYVQVGIVSYGNLESVTHSLEVEVFSYYNWIRNVVQRKVPNVDLCEKI